MKFYPKKFLKTAFIALFALTLGLSCLAFALSPNSVYADNENYSVFLPKTPLENTALSSPTHAYADDELTAITTAITPTNNKLLLSVYGDTPIELNFANQLGQIYRFNEYLLYRENLTIHAINIYDTTENLSLSYIDSENHSQSFNCNYCGFWDNGETLAVVVCLENTIQLFNVNEDADGKPTVNISSITYPQIKKAPVAINSTSVFYISPSNVLYKTNINNTVEPVSYSSVINPTAMVANDDYVYCIADNIIYRFSATDSTAPLTTLTAESEYELGTLSAPADIAFKGENLLITDNAGSVQEFKINGNTLEFTGYAVASGLTAYNRVAANATDIERYGKFVAALDSNKLTVIDTETHTDYDKDGFINKFVEEAPDRFALGNGTVLCASGAKVYIADVAPDTEDNKKLITGLPTETAPNDITYQSGIYYLIYSGIGANTNIYKIDEKTGKKINGDAVLFSGTDANAIAVDVFGNVYLADSVKVYQNENGNSYPLAGVIKLATDLSGNVFALANGKIYKLDQAENAFIQAFETALGNIKSFGLNFDKNEVFFLVEGYEQVYKTTALGQASLQDVVPDTAFNSATQSIKELKVYTVRNGANVYSVSATENTFNFNGLIQSAVEYPLISKFELRDNLTLYALASENGVVLVNEKDLTEKTVDITEFAAPEKAYTITQVSAYALPVIEKNDAFTLNTLSGIIRLDKGAEITATEEFTVLGKTFYKAQATINGETVDCYIPKSFTLTTLSGDIEFNAYSVEVVKNTTLYKNADLTEEISELKSGESVRVLSEQKGVLKVQVIKNGETVIGYISESAIKLKPNTVVRNVLIILAVFGSLAGTLTYFLLRKKK